ncbi:restriction endonuclease subunit S [Paraburkholderia sp. JHI2823]|uniref:restriction endonuclease subunit S n=1 Tax=Paraburkholderia sp. JHI2823 TaxID=3112960 RepID=UPI0031775158
MVRLGDHVDACLGKMLDAKKNKGSPQPYLGNSNVRWGAFNLADLAEMRFESHEEARYGLEPGDLVVCEGGEPGRCAIWTAAPGMKIQKALHRIRPKATLNNYYLFYWFRHAAKAGLLEPHFTGTTIKHLTGKAIAAIEIPLPPVETQIAMVETLKKLDERIDLLRQTNATLESIAHALFKSWFIDFDPVRAKAEGREPEGMDAKTAELFPDAFEDSALGEIPRGWTGIPFGELLSFAIGGDWGAEGPTDTCTQPATIIRGTDIPDIAAGQFDEVPRRFVSPKKSEKRTLQDGDLVIEVSGGSKTQPTGRSLYVTDGMLAKLGSTAVPTSFCRLFRAVDAHTALLLRQHLAAIYQTGKMWNYQVQSTGLANFQTQHFLDAEIVVMPPPPVRKAFFDIVRPLIDRAYSAPIAELVALRDTLLPRLISGKLRLPEAEAQLNEALA